MNKYQILLFYKYVVIENPEKIRQEQRSLCEQLHLLGRIIVATEGINGTLEGTKESIDAYKNEMQKNPLFADLQYKISDGMEGKAFPKLSVKVRPEIVTSKIPLSQFPHSKGKYITSTQLHEWYQSKKEFYLVDMRNDYEYSSGYFEGFIPSGMKHFFDLSQVPQRLSHLKEKTIVTVCTGGVRCEKASSYLVENGFTDVYQLQDGIHTYMERYPNQHFKGKLYVFDNRITLGFETESPQHIIVGMCKHCGASGDSYVNCEYDQCHAHYICCEKCKDKETGFAFCDSSCKQHYQEGEAKKSTKRSSLQKRRQTISSFSA